ncbi:hypothetical protein [Spirillospora sp. CA-294931]|uniref:hypothetical protein n=1 Tax=Spirillospora sp. CA-294931 TaxID=3240042 RepID=UPI003D90581A
MNRDRDVHAALKSLDPADREIDPRGARARADLARVLAAERPVVPPRGSRVRWRLALAGGVIAAVVAAVVALPSLTGGDSAFATWTPSPEGMSPKERAKAADGCRETQLDGAGTPYTGQLRAAKAVIAERRGVWTTVVLAGKDGFAATCVTDGSAGLFRDWFGSVGTPFRYRPPGPRDLDATDLGTGIIDAGSLSLAAGAAGSEVAKVVYRSRTRGEVAATVSGGRFALWLPGGEFENSSRTGVQVEATYTDGSRGTHRLRL